MMTYRYAYPVLLQLLSHTKVYENAYNTHAGCVYACNAEGPNTCVTDAN